MKTKAYLPVVQAIVLGLIVGLVQTTAIAASAKPSKGKVMAEKDIVDTAVGAGMFTTLATALTAADLISTLKSTGPFTVFAPTDDAFKKLPAGTVEKLLANKAELKKVLTYHVVSGKVMAADVVKMTEAKTVEGDTVAIKVDGGTVILGQDAKVTSADVKASNGVIHVIDHVLLPPNLKL